MKRLAPSLVALSLGFALGQSYVFLTSVDRETLARWAPSTKPPT